MKHFFESALESVLMHSVKLTNSKSINGGDINLTALLETAKEKYFIKWNERASTDMFEKEALGLEALRETKTFDIPQVIGFGKVQSKDFLILEFLENGTPKNSFWETFGSQLAAMHQHSSPKFGLDINNYIGKLPQPNEPNSDWVDFFIEKRIGFQLNLGVQNGNISNSFALRLEKIYTKIKELMPAEKPALIHGDLWNGNFMIGSEGRPVIYDPAVYYANREIELAFTRLFGGFDSKFYSSYQEVFPLEPGFEDRIDFYNIYPLLVHANLFGSSYLDSINRIIKRFI